jgi:hypothetical protein
MLRKLLLATLLAAGTVGGIALTPGTASAHDDRRGYGDRDDFRRNARFQVLVRHRGHWDVQGTYRDRDDAERVARRLERQGYDARIQRERW